MAKNVLSSSKDIGNLSRDLKDMRQKPDFQREHLMAPKIYFIEKGGGKGLDGCYIGAEWHKVAEIG